MTACDEKDGRSEQSEAERREVESGREREIENRERERERKKDRIQNSGDCKRFTPHKHIINIQLKIAAKHTLA